MSPVSPGDAPHSEDVAAIIVTYFPDLQRLQRLLESLVPQVTRIFVVDNTGDASLLLSDTLGSGAILIPLKENLGIAAAQNIGARAAMDSASRFVLLLDQDSLPAADMVPRLVSAWRSLTFAGNRVAAVGPRVLGRSGPAGFIRFGGLRRNIVHAAPSEHWVRCDMLIASGTLISMDSLAQVGGMNEALFIDKVDTEWCLRASARGLLHFGVPHATMDHALGHQDARAWIFGWRTFAVSRPFRYYYIFRNFFLVRRMPHATSRWCRAEGVECLKSLVYFGLVSGQRWANAIMMARGIADGLRGISGPMRR